MAGRPASPRAGWTLTCRFGHHGTKQPTTLASSVFPAIIFRLLKNHIRTMPCDHHEICMEPRHAATMQPASDVRSTSVAPRWRTVSREPSTRCHLSSVVTKFGGAQCDGRVPRPGGRLLVPQRFGPWQHTSTTRKVYSEPEDNAWKDDFISMFMHMFALFYLSQH